MRPPRLLFDDINPFEIGISEDCLTLNVWTPKAPKSQVKLPVLFYIHGGGFAVGARAKEVLLHYPGGSSTAQSARELGADLLINHSTWAWLEAHRKTAKSDVFRYRFDRAPKTPKGWFPDGADAGAFHSCEILYVMNNLDAFPWLVDANDQKVADIASGYWLNFVKSGNPNGTGLPAWPSYRDDNRPSLNINVSCNISHDAERTRQEFLASLLV